MARADNSSTTTSTTNSTTSSCVLDGEVTEGPYHVLGELVRKNITEGYAGVPVTYDVDFVDYTTCEPLKNAWIDVWHANSTGVYSGYTSSGAGAGSSGTPMTAMESGSASAAMPSSTGGAGSGGGGEGGEGGLNTLATDELSFDRGIWKTDEEGHLTMYDTIPGWYAGRAVHTHLKVYDESSGYQAENGTFVANNTAYHTGQWFYPQTFLDQLADLEPYSLNSLSYNDSTKNTEDTIYPDAATNSNEAEMTITFIDANNIMAGVIASTVVGVNLTYSSANVGQSYWGGNITLAGEASEDTSNNVSTSSTASSTTDAAVKSLSNPIVYMTAVTVLVVAVAHLVGV